METYIRQLKKKNFEIKVGNMHVLFSKLIHWIKTVLIWWTSANFIVLAVSKGCQRKYCNVLIFFFKSHTYVIKHRSLVMRVFFCVHQVKELESINVWAINQIYQLSDIVPYPEEMLKKSSLLFLNYTVLITEAECYAWVPWSIYVFE